MRKDYLELTSSRRSGKTKNINKMFKIQIAQF